MRRLLLLLALCMALALVFTQVAVAQSTSASASASAEDEFDCEDFEFQEDAQAVYDEDTSDPSGLDGPIGAAFDGEEGVACEDLSSRGSGGDVAIEDEAETAAEPDDDQYGVDEVQYETETGPTTASPSAELPDTGGPSFLAFALPTMALLVASGLLTFRIVRR